LNDIYFFFLLNYSGWDIQYYVTSNDKVDTRVLFQFLQEKLFIQGWGHGSSAKTLA
jgi:hypothetical protein